MEMFKLLYIAIGPGIALAVYLYYSDKWEREPKALVIKSFLLGGLACFPTSYFEGLIESVFGMEHIWNENYPMPWWQRALFAFFGVALVEELVPVPVQAFRELELLQVLVRVQVQPVLVLVQAVPPPLHPRSHPALEQAQSEHRS